MPKLLALDWDHHVLRLVLANRHAGRLTIDEIRAIPLIVDDEDETNASGSGTSTRRHLAEALSDARYRGADVLVSVRRADVELRLLKLPAVPADELPEIVRMQAMNEFSELSDNWPVDFLTLETTAEESNVLAAAISPRRMHEYQKVLDQAGLRAKAMVLRPTATALLVDALDASTRPQVEMCLEDLGRELELSVLRNGNPILIRTVQAPRSDSYDRVDFLAQEVKRTTLAARNQLHGDDVQRVVVFGAIDHDANHFGEQLQDRLQLPVSVLDPLSGVQFGRRTRQESRETDFQSDLEQRGQFAAAIGLLVGKGTEDSALIDFMNPRRFEPSKSPRRVAIAAATGLLIALLAVAGGFSMKLRSMDQQARDLQLQIQNQRASVAAAEQRLLEIASVDRWQRGNVNWLEQMRDVSSVLPGPEKARFLRWQADVLNDGNGQIILEGIVDEQETIGDIDRSLRSDRRRVRTAGSDFEGRVAGYPWHFKQTITVETEPLATDASSPSQRTSTPSRQRPKVTRPKVTRPKVTRPKVTRPGGTRP